MICTDCSACKQGALIPKDNVKHLMLRADVRDAVGEGKFHVYPIEHVDDAIALLTGVSAGARDDDGSFTAGTVNDRVEKRLVALAAGLRDFRKKGGRNAQAGDDPEEGRP